MAAQRMLLTRHRPWSERIIRRCSSWPPRWGPHDDRDRRDPVRPDAQFFQIVNLIDFLTGTVWSASIQPYQFGVLALVSGTAARGGHRHGHRDPARVAVGDPALNTRRIVSATSSNRCWRRSPGSRPSSSASCHQLPLAGSPQAPVRGPAPIGSGWWHRRRDPRHASHRLDLGGRDAGRATRPARRRLRDGCHQVRGHPQGGLAGRCLGDHGIDHPGDEPRCRRDDGCRPRCRTFPSCRSIRSRASKR